MTFDKILEYFISVDNITKWLDVSHQAVYKWKREGVPFARQLQIELLTDGELKIERKPMEKAEILREVFEPQIIAIEKSNKKKRIKGKTQKSKTQKPKASKTPKVSKPSKPKTQRLKASKASKVLKVPFFQSASNLMVKADLKRWKSENQRLGENQSAEKAKEVE